MEVCLWIDPNLEKKRKIYFRISKLFAQSSTAYVLYYYDYIKCTYIYMRNVFCVRYKSIDNNVLQLITMNSIFDSDIFLP